MAKLVPAANLLDYDDNDYTAPGTASYATRYLGLNDPNRIIDGSPYVLLSGDVSKGTWQYETPVDVGPFSSINHVATVKVNSGSMPGWAVMVIRDAVTGNRELGRWWKIPADSTYYDVTQVWTVNPFTQKPFDRDSIGGGQFRFGLARLPQFGPLRVTRSYVEPVL